MKRARLLQWLVFFFFFVRLFTHRVCTTFCEKFTFTKSTQYLILNASKGLYLEMQNPEGSPFQFFGAMRLSLPLFRVCEIFRNFLKSSKGPPSIFWCFAHEWMLKKPKGPPFTFFGTMRLLKIPIFRFFFENFENFSKFFNASEGSLLLFDILQQTGFSKSPKSPPFYNFKNFALFEPWIWHRL